MNPLATGLLLLLTATAFANQTGVDYQRDQTVVAHSQAQAVHAAQHFNPAVLPHYTPTPAQQGDYTGVTGSDTALKQQTTQQLAQDPAGKTVYQAFATRPRITINPASSDFADSNVAKQDSYNITHGISDQYIDCQRHAQCRTVMSTHRCTKRQPVSITCQQHATAKTQKVPYQTNVTYDGSVQSLGWTEWGITGQLTLPEAGVVKALTVTVTPYQTLHVGDNKPAVFTAAIQGQVFSQLTRCAQRDPFCYLHALVFTQSHLQQAAPKGLPLALAVHCQQKPPWGFKPACVFGPPQHATWHLTLQVTRYKDEGVVSWDQPVCP